MFKLVIEFYLFQHTAARRRLGYSSAPCRAFRLGFNTQPPEGGWFVVRGDQISYGVVSTHSRPKAAGGSLVRYMMGLTRFNTQPPEGGWLSCSPPTSVFLVSTHSRPKAAGF